MALFYKTVHISEQGGIETEIIQVGNKDIRRCALWRAIWISFEEHRAGKGAVRNAGERGGLFYKFCAIEGEVCDRKKTLYSRTTI